MSKVESTVYDSPIIFIHNFSNNHADMVKLRSEFVRESFGSSQVTGLLPDIPALALSPMTWQHRQPQQGLQELE